MKARPGQYCDCGCGEILTGKQRRWVSHAHKMRFFRRQEKEISSRVTLQNRDEIQTRQVQVRLRIDVIFKVKWAEWLDDSLVNRPIRLKLGEIIGAYLRRAHDDCQILAVKVERIME